MEDKNTFDKLREKCWKEAIYTFGTASIFEKRASRLRKLLKMLTFLGIAVPIFLGGTITSFGVDFKYLGLIIVIASILGIAQLVGSVWALVAKWEDEYAYSQESTVSNYSLSKNYRELGENPPSAFEEFRINTSLLDTENRIRCDSDYKHSISDKEKRRGHRATLRQFRRACDACKKIPASMKASDCDVCGNF